MYKWILLGLTVGAGLVTLISEPIQCVMALGPLAVAGIGLAANVIGSALKGSEQRTAQIPKWLQDKLLYEFENFRSDQFMPDTEELINLGDLEAEQILSSLPVSSERFNAEAASRGVFTSGEALSNLYRNVVTPVFSAAETARSRRRVQAEGLRLEGARTAEEFRQRLLSILAQSVSPELPPETFGDRLGDLLGEIGGFGTQLGIGQQLGIYPSGRSAGRPVVNPRYVRSAMSAGASLV